MKNPQSQHVTIPTGQGFVLASIPPLIPIPFQATAINPRAFPRTVNLVAGDQTSPRVTGIISRRNAPSAKVPYLKGPGGMADSGMASLRAIGDIGGGPRAGHLARAVGGD